MSHEGRMLMLKQLRLVGFKSFADETRFDFMPGITVIVGPNGCGKTNVVDSVKWALGEQSAKSLRGGHIGDVIFSGTRNRPAQHMAEATLLFNNADKFFPGEGSEVSISRRLFRDGKSEYLINGEQSRLKDIEGMLMDTGIGTSNYSLIEQGRVDWLINARPLERRIVIEEAAGVSKFKSKRDEALRKLEATARNLDRVEDIINELKSRKNSLMRQATKAERYQKERQRFVDLQRRWHFHAWYDFQSDIARTSLLEREAREKNERFTAEVARKEAFILERETEATQLEMALRELAVRNADSDKKIQERDKERVVIHADLRSLDERRHRAEANEKLLEEHREKLEQERLGLQEKLEDLEKEMQHFQVVMEEDSGKIRDIHASIRMARENLQKAQDGLLGSLHEETSLKNALEASERQGLRLDAEIDKAKRVKEERTSEMTALSKNMESIQAELAQASATLTAETAEVDSMAEDLVDTETALTLCQQKIKSTSESLHASESKLSVLQATVDSMEGYGAGVRAVLVAARDGELPGQKIYGALAELLQIPVDLALAFEAALEEDLQSIVVEDVATGTQAMEWLAATQKGRATFLPLKEMMAVLSQQKNVSADALPLETEGFLNRDLNGDERVLALVRGLLARCVLVSDRPPLGREVGTGLSFVSRKGLRWDESGRLSGGTSRDPSVGFIQRRGEMDRLAVETRQVRTDLFSLEERGRSLEETREDIARRLQQRRAALHDLEVKMARDGKQLEQWQMNQERLSRDLGVREEEMGALEKERLSEKTAAEEKAQRLLEVSDKIAGQRQALEVLRQEAERWEGSRQEAEVRVGETRVLLTRTEELTKGVQEAEARLRDSIQDHGEQMTKSRQEAESCVAETKRLQVRLEEIDQELTALEAVRREGEQKVQELEGLRNQEIQKARDEGDQLKELRKHLKEVEEELHRQEIVLSELKLKSSSVVERLREDLEVTCDPQEYPKLSDLGSKPLPEEIDELKKRIEAMGPVNLLAIEEYEELNTRYEFLVNQKQDLTASRASLEELISRIDSKTRALLSEAWNNIQKAFSECFRTLFRGGEARLVMVGSEDILEAGIGIEAQPPGKHLQSLLLLSGGEKAMTAIAFLFALLTVKSCPLCILDEVDAPLDEQNTERLLDLLQSFVGKSQFLIISHNRMTMEAGDALYGVTMKEEGVTSTVSVRLKGTPEEVSVPEG